MNDRIKGLTLIEVLIVSVLLVVVLTGVLGVYFTAMNYVDWAKELSIATDDARDVLEKIKNAAFANVTTEFPDGAGVVAADIGGFVLQNEAIVVTYPNGTVVDPLEIVVTVSWNNRRGGRARNLVFHTIRTGAL